MIFGEEKQAFDGTRVETCESLPFARTDFSLCTSIKSKRIGCIVCSVPENRVWEDDSKALIIDAAGLIEFISNQNILARSYSRVDDNKWHEVAVVYSDENKRYKTWFQGNFIHRFKLACTHVQGFSTVY